MNFKREEIQQYFEDYIESSDVVYDNSNFDDLHNDVFNTDYIIGTYKATQWCEDQVFNIIEFIKEYEINHFDKVMTDFSSAEDVVNSYVSIIGESIVHDYITGVDQIFKRGEQVSKDII